MSNCWIVGDVHGMAKTLQALVYRIRKTSPDETIVIAGDLVDRGPDSASVIQFCIDNDIKCVLGNHEQMMLDYCNGNEYYSGQWLQNGGAETRASYVDGQISQAHLDWLAALPRYLVYLDCVNDKGRKLFISHAGVYEPQNEDKDFRKQVNDLIANKDLWWHRDAIWDHPEWFQVIGHTPQPNGPSVHEHFACIDTGACYNRSKYNRLTALRFPAMQVISQESIDDQT